MALNYKELGRPYRDGSYSKGIKLVEKYVETLQKKGLLPRRFKALNKRPHGSFTREYAMPEGGISEAIRASLPEGRTMGPAMARLFDTLSPYVSKDNTISGKELDVRLYQDEPELTDRLRGMRRRELIKRTYAILQGTGYMVVNTTPIDSSRARQWPPVEGHYYLQRPISKTG